jgi:hypothetical protein
MEHNEIDLEIATSKLKSIKISIKTIGEKIDIYQKNLVFYELIS